MIRYESMLIVDGLVVSIWQTTHEVITALMNKEVPCLSVSSECIRTTDIPRNRQAYTTAHGLSVTESCVSVVNNKQNDATVGADTAA